MKSSVLKHVSLINYCIWHSNPSQIDLMLSSRSVGNSGRVGSPCQRCYWDPPRCPAGSPCSLGTDSSQCQLYHHSERDGLSNQGARRDRSERPVSSSVLQHRQQLAAVKHPQFKNYVPPLPSSSAHEHTDLLLVIKCPLWGKTRTKFSISFNSIQRVFNPN